MKKYIHLLLATLFLITDLSAQQVIRGSTGGGGSSVANNNVVIYVIAGQSNAQGQANAFTADAPYRNSDVLPREMMWNNNVGTFQTLLMGVNNQGEGTTAGETNNQGPEMSMLYNLAQAGGGDSVYVVKYAVGATQLTFSGSGATQDWNVKSPGELFSALLNRVAAAKTVLISKGKSVTIGGFLWVQGESDGWINQTATQYQTDLQALYDSVRIVWNNSTLPIVIGEESIKQGNVTPASRDSIRLGQVNFVAANPAARIINMDAFNLIDPYHYNNDGQEYLGMAASHYMATIHNSTPHYNEFFVGVNGRLHMDTAFVNKVIATWYAQNTQPAAAAPTNGIVNDSVGIDSYSWTDNLTYPGYFNYEQTFDAGTTYSQVLAKPITVGNLDKTIGQVGVRVKAGTNHSASPWLFNTVAFTKFIQGWIDFNKTNFVENPQSTLTLTPSSTGSLYAKKATLPEGYSGSLEWDYSSTLQSGGNAWIGLTFNSSIINAAGGTGYNGGISVKFGTTSPILTFVENDGTTSTFDMGTVGGYGQHIRFYRAADFTVTLQTSTDDVTWTTRHTYNTPAFGSGGPMYAQSNDAGATFKISNIEYILNTSPGDLLTGLSYFWRMESAPGYFNPEVISGSSTLRAMNSATIATTGGRMGNVMNIAAANQAGLTDNNIASVSAGYTVAFWWKPGTQLNTVNSLFTKGTSVNSNYEFDVNYDSGAGQINFNSNTGSGTNTISKAFTNDGAWHLIIVKYDGTTKSLRVDNTTAVTATVAQSVSNGKIAVGNNIALTAGAVGLFDQIRYYQLALPAARETDLWNGGYGL